jgi:serine/threonine protein kinase
MAQADVQATPAPVATSESTPAASACTAASSSSSSNSGSNTTPVDEDPRQKMQRAAQARLLEEKRKTFSILMQTMSSKCVQVNGKRYILIDKIGSGGSSIVYKAFSEDFQTVAIKRVRIGDLPKATYDGYINEINLLERLRGRDEIVQLLDSAVDYDEGLLHLVLELGETDFSNLLRQLQKKVANRANFIRLYWQQMLLAVAAIHEQKIVHGGMSSQAKTRQDKTSQVKNDGDGDGDLNAA